MPPRPHPKACSSCWRLLDPGAAASTCPRCAGRRKRRRRMKADAGLCDRCGRAPKLEHSPSCRTCYLKACSVSALGAARHWDALLAKLYAQAWKCKYSGETLVLGLNAALDHRMPRSRFPELASDPCNVDWTTRTVNLMKTDLTAEEWILKMQNILNWLSGL